MQPSLPPVHILGGGAQTGAYLLRVLLRAPAALAFGRFNGGAALPLPAGVYVYAGSAMGARGASSLARRLARHATRGGSLPPHPIRAQMVAAFRAAGLGAGDPLPRRPKTCFWHIDYLLDQPAAALTHVIALRSPAPLEAALAARLAADRCTAVVAPGLGAADARGASHLLRVAAADVEAWWGALAAFCGELAGGQRASNITGQRAEARHNG